MSIDVLLARLKIRLPDTQLSDDQLEEYLRTISDRLCLRLGVDELPAQFASICVDASVKMIRRIYYEGVSSESVANLSTSFVDDLLAEYAGEISDWKSNQADSGNSRKVVKFL